jgi:hypothetical protein
LKLGLSWKPLGVVEHAREALDDQVDALRRVGSIWFVEILAMISGSVLASVR